MSKIRSLASIVAAIEATTAINHTLQVALAEAHQSEDLQVGSVYPIQIGKVGATTIVDATLLGVFADEEGRNTFKFTYGEGADTEVVKISAARVKITGADGNPVKTVAQVEAAIAAAHAKLERLEEEAFAAAERENLAVGADYTIKVGRGESRRVVEAKLVGSAETDVGTRFKFIFGEGFDTELVVIAAEHIVWEEYEEPTNETATEEVEGDDGFPELD